MSQDSKPTKQPRLTGQLRLSGTRAEDRAFDVPLVVPQSLVIHAGLDNGETLDFGVLLHVNLLESVLNVGLCFEPNEMFMFTLFPTKDQQP